MPETTVWTYLTQWLGYLGYCASAYDPACRPFVGFLALFGASAGTFSMLVLGMVRILGGLEREVAAARASAMARVRENVIREKLRRPEPVIGIGEAMPAYLAHAEPLMAAASPIGAEPQGLPVASSVTVPLRTRA